MISQVLRGQQHSKLSQIIPQHEASDIWCEPDFKTPFCITPALDSRKELPTWTLPFWQKDQAHSRFNRGRNRCFVAYSHKRSYTRMALLLAFLLHLLAIALTITAICYPSYSNPPVHYSLLAKGCKTTGRPGCANAHGEKVLIAASLLDKNGELIKGSWGQAVLRLIDLIGPENVFLSIYLNNADAITEAGITDLKNTLRCNSSIVNEHFDFDSLPSIRLLNGESRVKRIAYLSQVRNKALLPLNDGSLHSNTRFDKLLYLNDIAFNPVHAAQLLFSTNLAENGRTDYRSACAVDFVNPFKFYDTFATRDLHGNGIGLPFFPWFSNKDNGHSRVDVLSQKDAVRVRSCWGGMVAFEAKWFQIDDKPDGIPPAMNQVNSKDTGDISKNLATSELSSQLPLRFRYETELYRESSECCLIQADMQSRAGSTRSSDTGIYINPFVRVAYDEQTLAWLPFTRRFEKLYSFVHHMLNVIIGLPRQQEQHKQEMYATTREPARTSNQLTIDIGEERYRHVSHIGREDGFCSSQMLLVLKDFPPVNGSHWYKILAP